MITTNYTNPMIYKTHDILKTLSADAKIRHEAKMREQSRINELILIAGEKKKSREEGLKEGKEIGMAEGKEIGEKKGIMKQNRNVVRRMLAKGVSVSEISEFTGLAAEEIEALKREL